MLKSEKPWTRHDMMDTWKLQAAGRGLPEDAARCWSMPASWGRTRTPPDKEEALAKIEERLKSKLRSEAASIRQKQRQLTEDLDRVEAEARARAQASAIRAAQQLEEAMEEAEQWGSAVGSGGRLPGRPEARAGPPAGRQRQAQEAHPHGGEDEVPRPGAAQAHLRAVQRGALRGGAGRRPGAPAAPGAGDAAPPVAAPGLSTPAAGERAAAVLAPWHGREAQGPGGGVPGRQLVDVGRQGALVQGGHPDPAGADAGASAARSAPSAFPQGTPRCTSST